MITANVKILNSRNEIIEISKNFKEHRDAESWIWTFVENSRCFHAECPSLAFEKLTFEGNVNEKL